MVKVTSHAHRQQCDSSPARVRGRLQCRRPVVGPTVRDDDADVAHVAAVSSAGCEDVVPHGVDGARCVRPSACVVEAEGVVDRVLHRVLVQVELDVRGVGVGLGGDATVPVQVEAVDDALHEVHLLDEVVLADATGGVQSKRYVSLHSASCSRRSRVLFILIKVCHQIERGDKEKGVRRGGREEDV